MVNLLIKPDNSVRFLVRQSSLVGSRMMVFFVGNAFAGSGFSKTRVI
jgi:hypothetical protein